MFFFLQKDIPNDENDLIYKNVVFKISALSPEVSIYHETS